MSETIDVVSLTKTVCLLSYLSGTHSLSIVAHIDLDAFYAQCEQVRLGLNGDAPVVCQQWNSLIAVSYAARKFGIKRGMSVQEARRLCPNVVLAHVATFEKGETEWKYHDSPSPIDHKVSLDPYRSESRKIFKIFKEHCSIVEKAGIDEAFIDLRPEVYQWIVEHCPEIKNHFEDVEQQGPLRSAKAPGPSRALIEQVKWIGVLAGRDDKKEHGEKEQDPEEGKGISEDKVPVSLEEREKRDEDSAEHVRAHLLGESSESQQEEQQAQDQQLEEIKNQTNESGEEDESLDWDDVCFMIASRLVNDIRAKVFDELGYTCSAGIASNRYIAKLASARNKPNNQTIVPLKQAINFIDQFEINDIWGYGGKLGSRIMKELNLPKTGTMKYFRENAQNLEIEKKLDSILGEGKGHKVFEVAQADYSSAILTRTTIKSMQSVKQFTSKNNTMKELEEWMKVFAADLAGRLIDLDQEGGSVNRPETIGVTARQSTPTIVANSKQNKCPSIVSARTKEALYTQLYEHGMKLLSQLKSDQKVLPCYGLSLSVSNIKDSRRLSMLDLFFPSSGVKRNARDERKDSETEKSSDVNNDEDDSLFVDQTIECTKCSKKIAQDEYYEHQDWHLALELQKEEDPTFGYSKMRSYMRSNNMNATPSKPRTAPPKKRKGNRSVLDMFKKADSTNQENS